MIIKVIAILILHWISGPDGIRDEEKYVWLGTARSHLLIADRLIKPASQADSNSFFFSSPHRN